MAEEKSTSQQQQKKEDDHGFERNPGIDFDQGWINEVQCNRPAIIRRAETHEQRRTVKKEAQLGWLLRVVTCMDLTTLNGDDTKSNVERMCAKAADPIRSDFLRPLDIEDKKITTGAVCVYPNRVADAVAALKGTNIPVASVAAGFPSGQIPLPQKLDEIRAAVKAGATEIDIVIPRDFVISGEWKKIYDEVKAMRKACAHAHLKVILSAGELPTFRDIYKASLVSMMAGADFIKTSTGKEKINATLPIGLVMIRAVRDFYERTGYKVGFKAAGGIATAKSALAWLSLMKEELGDAWTKPNLFRIGASTLLNDVERQIEHGLSGHYAARNYLSI